MKFKLGSILAYLIHETDDGCYISNCNGFVMESEQAIEVGKKLIEFSKKHAEELRQHNIERNIEYKKELEGYYSDSHTSKSKTTNKKGYVYLFECGGKYKIGFSKDPNRRLKELDKRPFKLNLVARSKQTSNAYDIEQDLHSKLQKYRINGEWYQLDDQLLKVVTHYIHKIY